jgi:hypothetical protein
MPASFKFAWRWMVGATAATILCVAALPGVGQAENIEITTGPSGSSGMQGVVGDPGLPGAQGPQGAPGIQGPAGGQGDSGPQGPQGAIGPTGPTGPAGIMGEDGVRGPTGLMGTTGPSGTPGISEPNISVLTGGSLGTLGSLNGTDLSGNNSVGSPGTILILGPGNGSDSAAPPASSANPEDAEVIMAEAGTAKRLFVNVDNDPGTQMNTGIPSTFFFFLCDGNGFPGTCGLTCFMTGPDTTCSDLADAQAFAKQDNMSLWAYADYAGANHANVKWSVTYDHGAGIIIP